jgi:2-hydroxymuconate-semialdehyde hydrolase
VTKLLVYLMNGEPMESRFLEVDGHRLAFALATGRASVVLIHGIPTHSYLWRNVAPALVTAGLPTIAVDLLGYGRSDKPVGVDLGIAAQARMLATALRLLNWRGGAIVGHDIGGGVAQLLAVNHSDLVRGLVLVDTIAYDSFPEPGIARLKEPAWDAILGAPDFDLKKGLTKGFMRGMVNSERVTPELIAAYERPFQGVEGRLAYLRAARALRTEELASQMDAVEHLKIPTLIIWGAEDPFQPRRYGERLAKAMPNARLDVITGASHFLPEDAPEPLAQRIVSFAEGRF